MEPSRFARCFAFAAAAALAMLGVPRASAAGRCDLSIVAFAADYDPRDRDLDAGPGRPGQDVNLFIAVSNEGELPIVSARLFIDATNGSCEAAGPIQIDDFNDVTSGMQRLDPGETYVARFPVPADAAACCGSYTVLISHDGAALRCIDGSLPVNGDDDPSNDQWVDRPDADGAPDDLTSPDALVIEPLDMTLTLSPASIVIESIETERLVFTASLDTDGPIPVTGTFFIDVVNGVNTDEVIVRNLTAPATRTVDSVHRSRTIRVLLTGHGFIPFGVPLKVAIRFGRADTLPTCPVVFSDDFTVEG
jgi:hypothetical protein